MALLLKFHRGRNGWYRFRVGDGGDPAEFKIAVDLIKEMIPLDKRKWLAEEEFWEVAPTLENERVLGAIFENGWRCVNHIKERSHQLRLF